MVPRNQIKVISFLILCSLTSVFNTNAEELPSTIKQQLLLGNYKKAIEQLQPLVDKNDAQAQYQYALLLLKGKGVNKSPKQAENLLIKAAETNANASLLLAKLYLSDNNSLTQHQKAEQYFNQAKKMGNRKAERYLKKYFSIRKVADKIDSNEIIKLVTSGDIKTMKSVLPCDNFLPILDNQQNNVLMLALKAKQIEMSKWILSKCEGSIKFNAFINDKNKQKNTVLHIIAKQNLTSMLPIILRKKIAINAVNNEGKSALIMAIENGNSRIAQHLINEKANIKIRDNKQHNALFYAKKNHLLLANLSKKTPLNNKPTIQQKLTIIKRQQRDSKSPYYQFPALMIATIEHQLAVIDYLINKNADPWEENNVGVNSIHYAMKDKNTKLLDRFLNINVSNVSIKQWLSLVKLTIKQGDFAFFRKINNRMKMGFDKNPLTNELAFENTPLYYAISFNQHEIFMEIFRHQKFSPKVYGYYLLLSSQLNLKQFSELLIDKGADLTQFDQKNHNALWYAIRFNNNDVALLLLKKGAKLSGYDYQQNSPLMNAVFNDNHELVSILLQYGADPEKISPSGNSALLLAAQGKPSILKLFLSRNPNIKVRNSESYTPLMLAVKHKCLDCIQALIKAGANPNRKSEQGENSFDLANNNSQILAILSQ